MVEIMQGDAYPLDMALYRKDGQLSTADDVEEVVVNIAHITKLFTNGDILSSEDGVWKIPLSSEETMSLVPGVIVPQVQVTWVGNVREGADLDKILIKEWRNKKALGVNG